MKPSCDNSACRRFRRWRRKRPTLSNPHLNDHQRKDQGRGDGPRYREALRACRFTRGNVETTEKKIETAIFPAGFYHTKAKAIRKASEELVERFGSRIPDTIEALLTLPGVGRKTANLVMTLAHNKAGICVDTHVHRITNRWGYVRTKTPYETEQALRAKLPKKHWIAINTILVMHGQNICKPISPFCSCCPVFKCCDRVDVTKSR